MPPKKNQTEPPLASKIEGDFGTGETSATTQPCAQGGGGGVAVAPRGGPQDPPRDLAAMNESRPAEAPPPAVNRDGLSYDTKHLAKHLPDTPQSAKLIKKEGAAHVFTDEATLRRVEEDLLTRGEPTGSVRGADRYGLRYDEPIGYRVDAAGNKLPLHYGEMKLDTATGKYHVIPRTGASK